jgi:hypothetical protein
LLEYDAFIVVSPTVRGIETNGLIESNESLIMALEFAESIAFVVISRSRIRIETNGVIKSNEGLFIAFEIDKRITLLARGFVGGAGLSIPNDLQKVTVKCGL